MKEQAFKVCPACCTPGACRDHATGEFCPPQAASDQSGEHEAKHHPSTGEQVALGLPRGWRSALQFARDLVDGERDCRAPSGQDRAQYTRALSVLDALLGAAPSNEAQPCVACSGMGYLDGVGDLCPECGVGSAPPAPQGGVVAWWLEGTSTVEFEQAPYHAGAEWTPLVACDRRSACVPVAPCAPRSAGWEIDAFACGEVRLQRSQQRDGSFLWRVTRHGDVLNNEGRWESEPLPSSRDEVFIGRCRFKSTADAIAAYTKAEQEG